MREEKKLNYWKAAIWSGIIAGIVMLVLEFILNPLILDNSMWGPIRMMGSILLGKEVLPPPATFDAGIFLAALAVHLPLSVVYGMIIGYLIRKISLAAALLVGIVIGYMIYLINFIGLAGLFPWFADARSWVQVIIHILFGLAVAWSFKTIYKDPGVRPAQ